MAEVTRIPPEPVEQDVVIRLSLREAKRLKWVLNQHEATSESRDRGLWGLLHNALGPTERHQKPRMDSAFHTYYVLLEPDE